MDLDLVKTLGWIAIPFGLAIIVCLHVVLNAIAKNAFSMLTKERCNYVIIVGTYIALSVTITGIAAWAYVATKIPANAEIGVSTPVKLPVLPGGTGWIFVGYFNIQYEAIIESPYVSVLGASSSCMRRFVEIGDTIVLKVACDVRIVDFKKTGATRKLVAPDINDIGNDSSMTPITLPAGTELVVVVDCV